MKNFANKLKKRNTRGFTFLEVIVATAIFSLLMVAVAGIFGKAFKSYRNAQAIQKDLENAQFALNLMAKTLRTSDVVECVPATGGCGPGVIGVKTYDYSQGKCIRYQFDNNKIKSSSDPQPTKDDCEFDIPPLDPLNPMTSQYVNSGSFDVVKSSGTQVGRVTISAEICPPGGCSGAEKDRARVQTTISLRNKEVSP